MTIIFSNKYVWFVNLLVIGILNIKAQNHYKPIVYSTYFGGDGKDEVSSLIIDENENLVFTGYTSSTDFNCSKTAISKTNSGKSDIFMAQLDSNISELLYFTQELHHPNVLKPTDI